MLWLVVVIGFACMQNLLYSYVIVNTADGKPRQFVGYTELYFGRVGRYLGLVVLLIGQWGALVAYIIGIGEFLALIFNAVGAAFFFSIISFLVISVLTMVNLKVVAAVEGWLTIGMILVIGLIASLGIPHIVIEKITFIPQDLTLVTLLLPYGVMMGSMAGFSIIPEIFQLWKKTDQSFRSFYYVVLAGTLVPGFLYLLFQYVVVGISGRETTQEAITGLVPYFDSGIIYIGAVLGVLAMGSSFLTLAYVLKDTFQHDFNLPRIRSWFLTMIPPLLVYLAGLKSFIVALDLMGTWLGTASFILVIALFIKIRRSRML